MLRGQIHYYSKTNKWYVKYYRTPQILTEIPVHPEDADRLTKRDHLSEIEFEIETIGIGIDEFSVTDCDVARVILNSELYSLIEAAVINWTIEDNRTAGELTREIVNIINKHKK